MRKITEIILHCSATKEGANFHAKDIDQWHRNRGFNEIGYNFVIDLDGTIEKGRDLEKIPAHCTGHNKNSIGICYVGGLDNNGQPKDTRTDAQKESLYKLLDSLLDKYNLDIDNVYGHYQFANKACPSFKIETLRTEYKNWCNKTYKTNKPDKPDRLYLQWQSYRQFIIDKFGKATLDKLDMDIDVYLTDQALIHNTFV